MLYQDSWRVGAGLSLSFSPRSSLFHSSSSRSHRIVSLPLFHRVTLSLFFSCFSSRSYSREVGSSPTGGLGGRRGRYFHLESPARHTHIHARSRGGRRRGSERWRKLSHGAAHRWLWSVVHWAFAEWEIILLCSSHFPYIYTERPTVCLFSFFSLPLSLALSLSPSARQKIPPTPFAGRVTGSLDHASCTARTEGVSQPRYHHTSSTTKPPVNDNKTMIINDRNDVDEVEDNDNDTIAAWTQGERSRRRRRRRRRRWRRRWWPRRRRWRRHRNDEHRDTKPWHRHPRSKTPRR